MSKKLTMDELNRITIDDFKKSDKLPVIVVLDNIRSLSNIGSVFRTADAFRIEAIHLCGITAQPPHREIHKTALSATQSVDWKYYENTMESVKELNEKGYTIISVEQVKDSLMLDKFKPENNKKYALVFGNEVKGVEDDIIDFSETCIEIPQWGTKHSLNISVSVGVVLWDIVLKLK